MGRNKILASIGALGLITLLMLLCPVVSGVQATSDTPAKDEVKTTARVYANAVISIAVSPEVDISITPKADGAFSSNSVGLRVATNNNTGYTVYLRSLDAEGKLRSNSAINHDTINPAAVAANSAELANNTWGYKVEGAEDLYHGVTAEDAQILRADDNTNGQYKVEFGAKLDTNITAGVYSGDVLFSAVANPMTITSLTELTYMQSLTSSICDASAENDTKQLIDTRDGKSYWVAKLKDGNCWMTQNLALDITEDGLSATDTDIEEDWNAKSRYAPQVTRNSSPWESSDSGTYSWNLGKYVMALPAKNDSCGSYLAGLSECTKVGAVDVSGEEWQPTFIAQEGTFTYPDGSNYNGYVAVDQANHTYDAHYLAGNYYQFNTATAGTGYMLSVNDQQAEASICPKGWKLPSATGKGFDTTGNFAYMYKQYGLATDYESGMIYNDQYNATKAPIYLVRAGYIASNRFALVGSIGIFWSNTIINTNKAYMSYLQSSNSLSPRSGYTGDDSTKYMGNTVRCMVLGK